MRSISSFVWVSLLLLLGACTIVPHTGRSALRLMDEDVLVRSAEISFEEMKREQRISTNKAYNDRLKRVGTRLAVIAESDMPGQSDWEFVVFEDDSMINAFAMPGGKVAVYTGLFNIVQSDDQLAAVVGHEIAHIVAGHGNERASQQLLVAGSALAIGVGASLSDLSSSERDLIVAAYGAGATVGVLFSYSRTHEFEADRIGLLYMAQAGYNPMAAVEFWEAMSAEKKGTPPEFLSTHPADHRRINQIKIHLPEVMPVYRASRP